MLDSSRVRFAAALLIIVGASLAAIPVSALPANPSVVSHIEVTSPRFVYLDGTETAAFRVEGSPCIPSEGAVNVAVDGCADEAPEISGTLSTAVLGFDAARRADEGERELPLVDTSSASADVLTVRFTVSVKRPGLFTVTALARPAVGVDPTFVPGSAFPEADTRDRDVVWHLGQLSAGQHDLTVQVRPGANEGFGGGYAPEVVIQRRESGGPVLPNVRGDGYGPAVDADTVTELHLTQRVSPLSGPPSFTIRPPHQASRGTPKDGGTWSGGMTADFFGGWRLDRDPPAESRDRRTEAQLGFAPESPSCWGLSTSLLRPTVHQTVVASLDHPTFKDWLDFRIATSAATDGPTEAFDGEAATAAYLVALDSSGGWDSPLPRNDAGKPSLLWDATYADAPWVDQTRGASGTEIGAGDPLPGGFSNLGAARHGILSLAALTMETMGGDVDNRAGTEERTGAPLRLTAPDGYGIGAVTSLTGYCGADGAGYRPDVVFERTGDSPLDPVIAAAITPTIPAGKFWVESSETPKGRTSQASTDAFLDLYPLNGSPAASTVEHVVAVPMHGHNEIAHVTTTQEFHRTLGPGTWIIRTSDRGIWIRPLTQDATGTQLRPGR